MRTRFCIAVVCVVCVAQAQAATLQPLGGEVFVNRGGGYQLVTGPVEVNPGDAVMANPNGRATIIYSDSCSVNVQPDLVATVTPNPPCGNPLSPDVAQSYAQAPPPPVPPPSGNDGAFWLGAAGVGLGVAGLGVAIYAVTRNNNNTTTTATLGCGSIGNPCFVSISP